MQLSWTAKFLVLVGVATGVAAFVATQAVSKEWAEPVIQSCSSEELFQESDLHDFEPMFGGSFICMLVQFLFELTKEPSGLIIFVTLACLALPGAMPMYLEAGKAGARGLLKYPLVTVLLSVVIGIGIVMPGIWVPSYLLFKGEGSVSRTQAFVSLGIVGCFSIGTIFLFALDTDSYAWTWTVSFFLGPAAALAPLALSFCTTPKTTDETVKQGAKLCTMIYLGSALLCFGGWALVVFTAINEYGASFSAIRGALWTDAGPVVAFMVLDTAGYYVGTICYLFAKNPYDAAVSVILTPLLGPGCAVALAMARQEISVVQAIDNKKKQN